MSEQADDARIAEIRVAHAPFDFGMHHPISGEWASRVSCKGCYEPWPCEQSVLLARLDALEAERDALTARLVAQLERATFALESVIATEPDAALTDDQEEERERQRKILAPKRKAMLPAIRRVVAEANALLTEGRNRAGRP